MIYIIKKYFEKFNFDSYLYNNQIVLKKDNFGNIIIKLRTRVTYQQKFDFL